MPRLTLRILLEAWEVLHSLCELKLSTFPKTTDVYKFNKLKQYCPKFERNTLTTMFCQYIECTGETANDILDFLSFVPNNRTELWAKPLVKIEEDVYSMCFSVVIHGNALRMLELWMRYSGIPIGDKGIGFEAYCIWYIKSMQKGQSQLQDFGIHDSSFNFTTESGSEELDVVIWFTNTIIICEAKCNYFPSSPIEMHSYYSTLDGAAEQVKRKADFVRSNLEAFLNQMPSIPAFSPDVVRVYPVILTNQQEGVGFPVNDIPVTDLLILNAYLERGYMHQFAIFEKGEMKASSKVDFYASSADAADKIENYLKEPPQVRQYVRYLTTADSGMPALAKDDKAIVIRHTKVELPFSGKKVESADGEIKIR
jgi:hypothetical protein